MSMNTNDTLIIDWTKDVDNGNIQFPDFQRGWVWNDMMICRYTKAQ